jgi:branched-subunit amino acid transport protein
MNTKSFLLYLFVMAAVTYLVRMIPFMLFNGKIKNRFFQSFLYYVPYTVLSAMTFPAILSATGSLLSAWIGLAVALLLAFLDQGLIKVALFASAAVLVTDLFLSFL